MLAQDMKLLLCCFEAYIRSEKALDYFAALFVTFLMFDNLRSGPLQVQVPSNQDSPDSIWFGTATCRVVFQFA